MYKTKKFDRRRGRVFIERNNYAQRATGFTSYQAKKYTGLDPKMFITFKYFQTFTFTNAAGVAQEQNFRMNSLFDPDVTGAGHQPYLYDFMIDKYNRYLVLKTRWVVTFSPGALSMHVAVVPTNGTIPVAVTNQATYEAAAELPFSKANIMTSRRNTQHSFAGCYCFERNKRRYAGAIRLR